MTATPIISHRKCIGRILVLFQLYVLQWEKGLGGGHELTLSDHHQILESSSVVEMDTFLPRGTLNSDLTILSVTLTVMVPTNKDKYRIFFLFFHYLTNRIYIKPYPRLWAP